MSRPVSRRQFLVSSAAGAIAIAGAPLVVTARKTDSDVVVGEGAHQYRVTHAWPQLPDKYTWQTTHNVAVDTAENLYVIHEGRAELTDHPSIFAFDKDGKFIRAFGQQYQGGGHGIEVRKEGSEEFLYVCAYQQVKEFSKLTLEGEIVWTKRAPMEAGVYHEDEAKNPQKVWGQDRFMPTNFAFLDDGGFLLADGYGSFYIHHYDKEGNWVSKFGGPGEGEGTFKTPHGIWVDRRKGREPQIVVCDRAHHTLQTFTMDGKYLSTLDGYGLPANIDTWQNLMLVPELMARITLLDENNEVAARLGEDVAFLESDEGKNLRGRPDAWREGRFVHPHDACFDPHGNIFVAEWVATGRVSKLERLT
jgi:hypothetical protein